MMGSWKTLFLNVLLLNIAMGYWPVMASIVDTDLTLSFMEKKVLEQFTEIMEDSLTQDYMKSDIYLIKWLRAGEMDINRAELMLKNHLQWREDKNVDTILDEDFSNLEREFPIDIEGVDRNGAPILSIESEDWDLRRGILTGKAEKLHRYAINRFEAAVSKIREAQKNGKNVTRLHFIENLKGYNIIQHSCIQCMPIQIRMLNDLQTQYPGMVDNLVYINAPTTIEVALRILLPLTSEELRKRVKIMGTNKAEWQPYLLDFISPDQLFRSFGGTRFHP